MAVSSVLIGVLGSVPTSTQSLGHSLLGQGSWHPQLKGDEVYLGMVSMVQEGRTRAAAAQWQVVGKQRTKGGEGRKMHFQVRPQPPLFLSGLLTAW